MWILWWLSTKRTNPILQLRAPKRNVQNSSSWSFFLLTYKNQLLGNILYYAKSHTHSSSSTNLSSNQEGARFHIFTSDYQRHHWRCFIKSQLVMPSPEVLLWLVSNKQSRPILKMKISNGHCQLRHLITLKYATLWCKASTKFAFKAALYLCHYHHRHDYHKHQFCQHCHHNHYFADKHNSF